MNFDNFKKIMQDKKKVVMVSVAVLLLLLAIVGTTYAYFTATVSGNSNNNNVVITNGVMALEYIDGNQVALTNAVPGDKVTKTFKVKNTGNVTTTYTIYMSELINNFADKTDLVYTLTGTNGGKTLSETQVPDSSSAIASDVSIDAGVTQEYTLVITFKETGDNQDDNQSKKFSTKIQINEYKNLNVGTSISENIISLYKNDTKHIENVCESTSETSECHDQEVLTNFSDDDPDNNIRYIGTNPSNYVYFNCDDYENQNDETCEKWRIVGLFNDIEKADGTKEDLIKLVRNDYIADYTKWSTNDDGLFANSKLQKSLNDFYLNGKASSTSSLSNSLTKFKAQYLYSETSNESTNEVTDEITNEDIHDEVTREDVQIKNDVTRNAIENVVWNSGNTVSISSDTPSVIRIYNSERKDSSKAWTGKIGLLYSSDVAYSITKGEKNSRLLCMKYSPSIWKFPFDHLGLEDCGNSYLLFSSPYDNGYWTLDSGLLSDSTPYTDVIGIYGWFLSSPKPSEYSSVYPALYLKSSIKMTDGDGTSSNPYQLKIG